MSVRFGGSYRFVPVRLETVRWFVSVRVGSVRVGSVLAVPVRFVATLLFQLRALAGMELEPG